MLEAMASQEFVTIENQLSRPATATEASD